MNRLSIFLFFSAILCVFLLTSNVQASDQVASSCSASDIQSAVDTCMNGGGGTVTIPACDYSNSCNNGSCWTGSEHVEVDGDSPDVRIVGQGIHATKIRFENSRAFFLRGKAIRELGQFTLDGNNGDGRSFFVAHGIENAIIHDVVTQKLYGSTGVLCGTKNVVIHGCTFWDTTGLGSSYHFYLYGDETFTDDWTSNWGSNNYQVFFEDNVFHDGVHHPISQFTSATAVVRHNTFNWADTSSNCTGNIDAHEPGYGDCPGDSGTYNWDSWDTYVDGTTETELTHGGQAYEIYNNTWNWTGTGKFAYTARIRSGATIYTGNTLNSSGYPSNYIDDACRFVCDNKSNGPRCSAEYGYPLDITWHQGPKSNRTVCAHPTDGCCEKPFGSYVWGNILNGANNEVTVEEPCGNGSLVEGVDYFHRAPNEQADGFTWTPYEYPHPLRSGTPPTDQTPPSRPTGLEIDRIEYY